MESASAHLGRVVVQLELGHQTEDGVSGCSGDVTPCRALLDESGAMAGWQCETSHKHDVEEGEQPR